MLRLAQFSDMQIEREKLTGLDFGRAIILFLLILIFVQGVLSDTTATHQHLHLLFFQLFSFPLEALVVHFCQALCLRSLFPHFRAVVLVESLHLLQADIGLLSLLLLHAEGAEMLVLLQNFGLTRVRIHLRVQWRVLSHLGVLLRIQKLVRLLPRLRFEGHRDFLAEL